MGTLSSAPLRAPRVVEGKTLRREIPALPRSPIFVPCDRYDYNGGTAEGGAIFLPDAGVLDRHVLAVGGIGQGKTNLMYHLLSHVQGTLGENDVAVIFDTKGDYLRFRRKNDIVINHPRHEDEDAWNIFAELPSQDTEDLQETASEIAHTLFDEALEHTTQRFFPAAAMQLVAACLLHSELLCEDPADAATLTNASLLNFWSNRDRLVERLKKCPETQGLCYYIGDGALEQGTSVLAEVVQTLNDVFLGRFRNPPARGRGFSIREAVRKRGGRCIFIEYRIRAGKAHEALYRILMDLAIKEALSVSIPPDGTVKGRAYFFLDELRLLPRLAHLDNGVNFGRQFGLRFIAGMQTHAQMKAAYKDDADSIMSGFNTIFAFRTTNSDSRSFIQGIAGHNKKYHIQTFIASQTTQNLEPNANVVEDHDIWDLQTGQAVVFLPNLDPFIAKLQLYKDRS